MGKRFVGDLNSLLGELASCKPNFIRCIKPNAEQKPRLFTANLVLDQLRCSGVIEAVRVMQEAYPTRIPYEDIHGRYAPLMGDEIMADSSGEPAAFCEAIALACEVSPTDYALGLTKLFLKAGCGAFLEDLATMDPLVVVPLLTEKMAASKRKRAASAMVGNNVLGWYRRKQFKDQKRAAERAQHQMRTMKARREYQKWSKARQERLRKEAEERMKREAEERAAREAEEALRKKQEAELAQLKAAEAEQKRKEHEAQMADAVEQAKKDAADRIAQEIAAVDAAAADSAARNQDKRSRDMARPDFEDKADDESMQQLQQAKAAGSRRRSSVMKDRATLQALADEVEGGADAPSLAKA